MFYILYLIYSRITTIVVSITMKYHEAVAWVVKQNIMYKFKYPKVPTSDIFMVLLITS